MSQFENSELDDYRQTQTNVTKNLLTCRDLSSFSLSFEDFVSNPKLRTVRGVQARQELSGSTIISSSYQQFAIFSQRVFATNQG